MARGLQVSMPQQRLDGSQVDAGVEQMRGEGVPEAMDGDALFEA
jgi:hypothetical protein